MRAREKEMRRKREVEGAYKSPEIVVDEGASASRCRGRRGSQIGEEFGGSPDPSSLHGYTLRLQSTAYGDGSGVRNWDTPISDEKF